MNEDSERPDGRLMPGQEVRELDQLRARMSECDSAQTEPLCAASTLTCNSL